MKICGIDNGLDGGIVILDDAGFVARASVMPVIMSQTMKREYDITAICHGFVSYRPDHVFLEKAQAMPGQGVASMFSIGNGYGIMRGLLTAMNIPHTLVHPKTWQKEMFRDLPKCDTKAMSAVVCSQLWPQMSWKATERCKKAHDGMTDAALIAAYGSRILNSFS